MVNLVFLRRSFYLFLSVLTLMTLWPQVAPDFTSNSSSIRSIASDDFPIDEILSIDKSKLVYKEGEFNLKDLYIQNVGRDFPILKYTEAKLNPHEAYRIVPGVHDGIPFIEIFYTKASLKDLGASVYIKNFLVQFTKKTFNTTASFHEYYFNARATRVFSTKIAHAAMRKTLSEMRTVFREHFPTYDFIPYAKLMFEKLYHLEKLDRIIQAKMNSHKYDLKNARTAKLKTALKNMDEQKLKMLIMNNNRKEVARLLSLALPWEEFNKVEEEFWKISLDAIANPVPLKDRILIYRGIGEIPTHSYDQKGVPRDTFQSYKMNDFYVLSNMFNDQQGEISTSLNNYEKFYYNVLLYSDHNNKELIKDSVLTTLFRNHSNNSRFSPMISMTPRINIANVFGKGKIIAAALDPRLVNFNHANTLLNEVEFLTPFTLFPDDIVGSYNTNYQNLGDDTVAIKNFLDTQALRRFRESSSEGIKDYRYFIKNSETFFNKAKKAYETSLVRRVHLPLANNVLNIYKKILKNNPLEIPKSETLPVRLDGGAGKVVTKEVKVQATGAASCQSAMSSFL